MPIYDWTCPKCEHKWEESATIADSEAGKVKCPKCGTTGEKQMPAIKPHVSWGSWNDHRRVG